MNFKQKSALQFILSSLPGGHHINYLFQRYGTKSLPRSQKKVDETIESALAHYNNYLTYSEKTSCNSTYFEFGAGWDLIIPLCMSFFFDEVYTIDIRKLAKISLVSDALDKIKKNVHLTEFIKTNSISDPSRFEYHGKIKGFKELEKKKWITVQCRRCREFKHSF